MQGENEDHDAPTTFNLILLRAAQGHLEHAKALDPENVVANGFLEKLPTLANPPHERREPDRDLDIESTALGVERSNRPQKRVRT